MKNAYFCILEEAIFKVDWSESKKKEMMKMITILENEARQVADGSTIFHSSYRNITEYIRKNVDYKNKWVNSSELSIQS